MACYLNVDSLSTQLVIWIIGTIFMILISVGGFSTKSWFTTLITEIRDIKKELKIMNESLIINTQEIKGLKEKADDHHARLTIVEKRVDKIHDEIIYKR